MKNVGPVDRVIRVILGVAILAYFAFGTWSAWGFLGILLVATGLVGYCPLYSLLHIRTSRPSTT